MAPDQALLRCLARQLGSALAFADDVSELQLQATKSTLTSAAMNSVARSFVIAELREALTGQHRLLEQHTNLNKVVVKDLSSGIRYWLKSAAAVAFTFDQNPTLFAFPSELHVLTFAIERSEVEFRHAPVTQLQSKRFKLEMPLADLGRFTLGGATPPSGYPSSRVQGIFEPGVEDNYADLFVDIDDEGAAEASA